MALIVVAGLVFGYLAIFVIMKWVSWHFESDSDRVRPRVRTEEDEKNRSNEFNGTKK